MKILVTGAAGFLGANTVGSLSSAGHQVRALLRRTPPGNQWKDPAVEVVHGDVTSRESMLEATKGVDAVVNLAGKLYGPGVPSQVYSDTHVLGTRTLLEACAQNGAVKCLVHCSTTGVLGDTGGVLAGEDAPYRPGNDYERTKLEGELVARRLSASLGLPLVVLRPGLVYGPHDLHLLGLFKTIKRRLFRLIGSGSNRFHPIYVDDFVAAVHLCLENGRAKGGVYNIAGDRPVTVRELTSEIAASLGTSIGGAPLPVWLARLIAMGFETIPGVPKDKLPLTRSRVDFLVSDRTYSIAKARDELGFDPKIGLSDGISRTASWYRSNGYL